MKKDYNSLDYVKQKFDSAFLETPDSLSESAIKEKLGNLPEQNAPKKAKRIPLKQIISIAACFILVVTTLTSFNALSGKIPPVTGVKNGVTSSAVSTFGSYDEIYDYIKAADERAKELEKMYSEVLDGGDPLLTGVPTDFTYSVSGDGTYIQEKDVNKSDIVKKYGNYIFTHDNFDVLIYRTDNGSAEFAAKADCSDHEFKSVDTVVEDMYVSNGILAVNTTRHDGRYFNSEELAADDPHLNYACCETVLKLFDISKPESPKFITQIVQSGDYYTSRLIGNTEYIISTHYTSDFCDEAKTPYIVTDERENIDCSDISYMEDGITSDCTVICAIDITTGEVYETKAVYGITHDIYCTTDSIYLTNYDYLENDGTQIIKASINNSTLNFTAQTKIGGNILNQFSMNEKDGNLRVAVTDGNFLNENNILYIFDENLNILGRSEDFGKGERIQSVCFIGNTAYVITYEQTDPLFAIDLSNPEAPEIKGEVEITGFSSQLVPVNETTLLGIGTESITDDDGFILKSGLKFALFDVSDPENPTVLDSIMLEDTYSHAQYEHKAITVNPQKGYIAIPISRDSEKNSFGYDYSIITLTANDGKINITNTFDCQIPGNMPHVNDSRCVYINDYIYSVMDGTVGDSFYIK